MRTYNEQLTFISMFHSGSAADDLAASMDRENLKLANLAKKQKVANPMNLDNDHPLLSPPTG